MLDILTRFWYIWLLVLISAIYKVFMPTIKGWFGEKQVTWYLRKLSEEYTVLNDIILHTETGTTQIDHVVVSPYGVFVIETKNYKGWIFGEEKSTQWTQNIYGKKSNFMNPLRQNYAHVKAIKAALSQFPSLPVIPIVAFSPNCDLKVKTESHVVYFRQVPAVIHSYTDKVAQSDDIATAVSLLQNTNIRSTTVKKEHIANVVAKKTAFENIAAGDTCPRCGGIIVLRSGKNGKFLGCSNYPKCRFTKAILKGMPRSL